MEAEFKGRAYGSEEPADRDDELWPGGRCPRRRLLRFRQGEGDQAPGGGRLLCAGMEDVLKRAAPLHRHDAWEDMNLRELLRDAQARP